MDFFGIYFMMTKDSKHFDNLHPILDKLKVSLIKIKSNLQIKTMDMHRDIIWLFKIQRSDRKPENYILYKFK